MSDLHHQKKLIELEREIWRHVRKFRSDELFLSVHNIIKGGVKLPGRIDDQRTGALLMPFIAAGICSFAMRFSNPHRNHAAPTLNDMAILANTVFEYLTADPVGLDKEATETFHCSNPVFMMLRVVGSQFPFDGGSHGFVGRTLLLYRTLIHEESENEEITKFRFEEKFQKMTGLSAMEFVSCGFATWAFFNSPRTSGLTRKYFDTARNAGLNIPDDDGVQLMLECISADPVKFRNKFEIMKQLDSSFRMYDFNPLLSYPVLRPWKQGKDAMSNDRIIAPLPDLIPYRVSTGIYYEMFYEYREDFSRFFGHLFEAYVGRLLKASTHCPIVSEKKIRETYPESSGKVPDFCIIEGGTALIIECKATRFSLKALGTGAQEAVSESLKQIKKGIVQLHDFKTAIKERRKGLETFYSCNVIIPIVITYEWLYFINTELLKELIFEELKFQSISTFDFHVLSVQELEGLQPHLLNGIAISSAIESLSSRSFNEVIEKYTADDGLTYGDSFLYKFDREMLECMGVAG